MPQTSLNPLSLLPLSISPFGNKAPKRKAKLLLGWRRWSRLAGCGDEAVSVVVRGDGGRLGVVGGGAEELGGAEDATASMTTLVASVKGADETGRVSAEEGRTAVRRIGSKVRVVTGRD